MTQQAPALNWIFTLNNYNQEEYEALCNTECQYQIIGKERGKEGTPHLQGYIQFTKKTRITALKKLSPRAHWEKARGTPEENQRYCSKDGDFQEKGTISIKGKRKLDMVMAVSQILEGASTEELVEQHGAGYIMNKRKIEECARDIEEQRAIKRQKVEMETEKLRAWQEEALKKLENQNSRQILFVVDFEGNKGKTFFSKWLVLMKGAIRFENGRSIDIKAGFVGQEYVVFDLVRSSQDHINWEAMESIKNGIMFSSKYHSVMKIYRPPKVVVFINHIPDQTKLSRDRYDIMMI